MTKYINDEIFEPLSKCGFYIVDAEAQELRNWAWQVWNRNTSTTIRFVRGHKATTAPRLFDEFAAALQFPLHFGENWNAFRDCIQDLDWLPGEAYGVVIVNAHNLLEQRPESLDSLIRILNETPSEFSLIGRRFATIFQCEGKNKVKVQEMLDSFGVFFQEIEIN